MAVTKTPLCHLLTTGETSGGPLCISALALAKRWQGTEHEASLYWEVITQMGTAAFFAYSPTYSFFGTETGNFALFEGANTLVIVEIISIKEEVALPPCLEFTFQPDTSTAVALHGLTCFFDASLSLPLDLPAQPARYALGQPGVWDTVVLECSYQAVYPVSLQLSTLHLEGLCFRTT